MRLRLFNRQSEVRLRVRPLLRRLKASLDFLPRRLPAQMRQVDIVLIERGVMTKLHAEFMDDPTPTDVITFPGGAIGEIAVCPAVARERAPEFGHDVETEVLLYGLHGLLHLAGYDDTSPMKAKVMRREQDKLLARVSKVPVARPKLRD